MASLRSQITGLNKDADESKKQVEQLQADVKRLVGENGDLQVKVHLGDPARYRSAADGAEDKGLGRILPKC